MSAPLTIAQYLSATQAGLRVTGWALARLRIARHVVAGAHSMLQQIEAHLAALEMERAIREGEESGAIYCAEEGHA